MSEEPTKPDTKELTIRNAYGDALMPGAGELNALKYSIESVNEAKGFHDGDITTDSICRLLMLVVTEICEAVEHMRSVDNIKREIQTTNNIVCNIAANNPIREVEYMRNTDAMIFKGVVKDSFGDEIADAIIRLLDLSGLLGIEIGEHIICKLMYNVSRPYRHGKQF